MLKPEHITFTQIERAFPNTFEIRAVADRIVTATRFQGPPWGSEIDVAHMAKEDTFRHLWEIFYGEIRTAVVELLKLSPNSAYDDFQRQECLKRLYALLKCPVRQIPHENTPARSLPGNSGFGNPPPNGSYSTGGGSWPADGRSGSGF